MPPSASLEPLVQSLTQINGTFPETRTGPEPPHPCPASLPRDLVRNRVRPCSTLLRTPAGFLLHSGEKLSPRCGPRAHEISHRAFCPRPPPSALSSLSSVTWPPRLLHGLQACQARPCLRAFTPPCPLPKMLCPAPHLLPVSIQTSPPPSCTPVPPLLGLLSCDTANTSLAPLGFGL